jgi:hypothetical protein
MRKDRIGKAPRGTNVVQKYSKTTDKNNATVAMC